MNFVEWKYLDPLRVNKFGMLEPILQNKTIVPNFMLVPLLAFDKNNNRLGYGKGFYDKFLNKFLRIKKNITIREVLYMNDNIIKNGNIVEVIKRPSSPLSTKTCINSA